jgi:phosphomannomutase/phosphoglucomutase
MDATGRTPAQLLSHVKQYAASPEMRIEVTETKKYEIVEQLKGVYRGRFPVSEIDGVKVYFPDGWALVRVSNTQPAIVVRVEGNTAADMERIQDEFLAHIREAMA